MAKCKTVAPQPRRGKRSQADEIAEANREIPRHVIVVREIQCHFGHGRYESCNIGEAKVPQGTRSGTTEVSEMLALYFKFTILAYRIRLAPNFQAFKRILARLLLHKPERLNFSTNPNPAPVVIYFTTFPDLYTNLLQN